MQGPTLTMSAVFDTNSTFPRSHSSPNIPDLTNVDYNRHAERTGGELPRSASFSCIPSLETQYNGETGMQQVGSADGPAVSPERNHKGTDGKDGKASNGPGGEERPKLERMGRRKSLVARPKTWIQRVKGSPERHESPELVSPAASKASKATRDKKKIVSDSFATFAKKSWISSSRSPSPSRNRGRDAEYEGQMEHISKAAVLPPSFTAHPPMASSKLEIPVAAKFPDSPPKRSLRTGLTLSKMKQRPQSVLMNFTTLNSANSSSSSLPRSRSSMDNRSTPRTSTDKIPPIPKTLSTEKLLNPEIDTPRKRDELWSAFRSLENDFSKFQAKSWSLKTNVVRSSLLPFLRNHATHPSNKNLRPEDLDRRITTLNKWWIGLLEVLDGRQNQTVSGVDRPVLLEATTAIMTRPEWRQAPSQFAPLSEVSPDLISDGLPLRSKMSSASLQSSASQFMAESVYHNARIFFIQNLLAQMTFVVDKMSLRHAPASLVTFCGKAAAYAFFFVPGVADVLVRIWKLQAETLRRTADELGLPRRLNNDEVNEVVSRFPSHIHQLGWTSVKSMVTQLRRKADLPVAASKIPWYGPWVSRWCGRDSDLFFVFTKHYHILGEEFLYPDLSFKEKSRAPGFVLVQSQVMAVIDSTIHRQATADPLPVTFNNVLTGADASAAALPFPSNNSARPMAENRLIMLLRDFMSERPSDFEPARLTFAEAFSKMMQASARRTSLFDHNACFVLYDFMEEALIIFVRFHHSHPLESDFISWHFWFDVCKKMLESQNSMSEIRLFAFLFGTWNLITSDKRRKEIICLEWLLTEGTFDKFFNHWCPMVRAYYMRLLCWRLCRDDEEATDLHTKIFSAVSMRIKSNWSHYLFLKQAAEKEGVLPPSISPCHPAPGRRLMIIRNDNQSPAASPFLGFDGIVSSSSPSTAGTTQPTAYKRHSSLAKLSTLETADTSTPKLTTDSPAAAHKKRWTFMGNLLPYSLASSTEGSSSPNQSRVSSPTKTLEEARREIALARSRPARHSKTSSSDNETTSTTVPTHRAFSFKFSLEWSQHFDKAQKSGNGRGGPGLDAGKERRLGPPRLPTPAQAWIGARVPGMSREVGPRDPAEGPAGAERARRATYAGRALAEWTLTVGECNNFFERRRSEGVPGLRWVEVPTLGVDGFRRLGA